MAVIKRYGSSYGMIELRYPVRKSSGTIATAEAPKLEERWRAEIQERVRIGKAPDCPPSQAAR
jgi:hypothetical protein